MFVEAKHRQPKILSEEKLGCSLYKRSKGVLFEMTGEGTRFIRKTACLIA